MNKIINKKKKAFTLIELIIVLAIMAIIAAIAIPNFIAVRDNSKNKADTQSCAVIQRTVLMLTSDNTIPAGDKTFDISVATGSAVTTSSDTTATGTTDETTLNTALKDVKAPQGKAGGTGTTDAKTYHIAISSGVVTVVTQ